MGIEEHASPYMRNEMPQMCDGIREVVEDADMKQDIALAAQCAEPDLVKPMIELLLSHGADKDVETDHGRSAHQLAEERGVPESVLRLLEGESQSQLHERTERST